VFGSPPAQPRFFPASVEGAITQAEFDAIKEKALA
jgi:hypothetical protein